MLYVLGILDFGYLFLNKYLNCCFQKFSSVDASYITTDFQFPILYEYMSGICRVLQPLHLLEANI